MTIFPDSIWFSINKPKSQCAIIYYIVGIASNIPKSPCAIMYHIVGNENDLLSDDGGEGISDCVPDLAGGAQLCKSWT